jgi:hypothetical protein
MGEQIGSKQNDLLCSNFDPENGDSKFFRNLWLLHSFRSHKILLFIYVMLPTLNRAYVCWNSEVEYYLVSFYKWVTKCGVDAWMLQSDNPTNSTHLRRL